MNSRQGYSRRQFLKATSTVAVGVPLLLRSNVFAAADSPGNRLTLGFIGMGRQSRNLLSSFLRRPETQVLAVCDADQSRREQARKTVEDFYAGKSGSSSHPSCGAYGDFQELLARKDIDAVVIATPDHWHAIIAIAAAQSGKDIYCEKPLSQSIHEARAMVNAAGKNQRVFQTGSMQRSMREFRTAVELIRNGVLGRITRAEVAVGGPGIPCDLPAEPDESGLDWNRWLGPAPSRPYNSILSPRGIYDLYPMWRKYREYGGGMVTDWGAHHFDIVQWALGMDHSGPVEIFPAAGPDAQSGVKLLYANGTEVTHIPGNGITFYGTDGKLYVNRGKFELWIGSEKKADSTAKLDAVIAEYLGGKAERVYTSIDHHRNWLECIRSRKPPVAEAEIGARSVTVCHLVNLAYYHGQHMNWDPKAETFAGGAGDPKWLDVAYRSPWKLA